MQHGDRGESTNPHQSRRRSVSLLQGASRSDELIDTKRGETTMAQQPQTRDNNINSSTAAAIKNENKDHVNGTPHPIVELKEISSDSMDLIVCHNIPITTTKELKTKELKTKELKTKELKTKELKTMELKTTELKTKELITTVVEHSRDIVSEEGVTTSRGLTASDDNASTESDKCGNLLTVIPKTEIVRIRVRAGERKNKPTRLLIPNAFDTSV